MGYTIVKCEEKSFFGLGLRTKNANSQGLMDIGKTWKEFYHCNFIDVLPSQAEKVVFGVYSGYENDFTGEYNFHACVQISELDDSQKIIAPSGLYACFEGKGDIPQLTAIL